ncbi:cytochrome c3 family protein [Thioalkalivibrio paradoxus]|uniref:cytochrome c3 family protein n=1 Tax=Thioalkalivibrio paradoxus TaxID=108010 RepID=UPI00022C2175
MTGSVSSSGWACGSRAGLVVRLLNAVLLLTLVALAGCQWDETTEVEGTFPHQPHLEFQLPCATCHELTEETFENPPMEVCMTCHDLDDAEVFGRCQDCHQKYRVEITEESPFDHRYFFSDAVPTNLLDVRYRHADFPVENDNQCLFCHGNLPTSMGSTFANIPTMEVAMAAHRSRGLTLDCGACHLELNRLSPPPSHNAHWTRDHGRLTVFQDRSQCLLCHQESTCQTCHSLEKPRDHTSLFRRKTHGMVASWDRSRCLTCHRYAACQSCHLAAASPIPPRGFHRPGHRSSCLSCHSPAAAAFGGRNRPADRFKPMPHRMLMGVSSQKCLECHRF